MARHKNGLAVDYDGSPRCDRCNDEQPPYTNLCGMCQRIWTKCIKFRGNGNGLHPDRGPAPFELPLVFLDEVAAAMD